MTVFKTFLKVLNKNKFIVILYTVILIIFAGFNMQTNEMNVNFTPSKPKVVIQNLDREVGITKHLISYIEEHSEVVEIKEDMLDDALFYRDINMIISIPKNFHDDFFNAKDPKLGIQSTKDYLSSLESMMLERYLKVASTYLSVSKDETSLISLLDQTLKQEAQIEMTSKLNTESLSKVAFYYNFLNYSILAGLVYIVSLILCSFHEEKIRRRTLVSSMNYKKYNGILLLSNSLFSICLWLFYMILGYFLLGDILFTAQGLFYILNSFVFMICAFTLSFLIGTIFHEKNAISGLVNVISLGSSFLCGAFVPLSMLPESVLNIAHILPSYYYIKSNEILKTLEVINGTTLKPIFINEGILICFSIFFIILTNVISKRRQKA